MRYAITRQVSATIGRCELTHLKRDPIDVDRARTQHQAYCDQLSEAGWTVIQLPMAAAWADSVFVEDTAVVTDEVAVIARPGAPSRRPEVAPIAEVLGRFRELVAIEVPATLDGGDVLRIGRRVWVGLSSRTNENGIERLREILEPLGYSVRAVTVEQCLHLKSAATAVGPEAVLINPEWIRADVFDGLETLEVDAAEPHAANALWLGHVTLTSDAYPRTMERLQDSGISCRCVDVSELARAEGALTCCSILLNA